VLVDSFLYNAAGWLDSQTDPRGIVNKTTYDAKGRVWKTFENYTDGVPTNSSNKTTVFNYDGDANVVYYEVDLPGGAYQKTQYGFNATTAAGNDVTSNDVFVAVNYPDKSTGAPSSSEQETNTVNRLGDAKTVTDRNGTVHTYTYDVLGRQTADAVTTLGSGVDGAVRRLETSYNALGLLYQMTSYNAASAGSIVNQVQDGYNGLGQLTVEYQAHAGAVNTGTSPKVQYAYTEMAGGANNSRQTSLTYPNGRVLTPLFPPFARGE
jgi:YD repeat-containing protein